MGAAKVTIAWIGTLFGLSLTEFAQFCVLGITFIFTVLQTWVLLRDKILPRRPRTHTRKED